MNNTDQKDKHVLKQLLKKINAAASNNNPELVTITIGGHEYNFKDVKYFTFKSQIEHYADNLSDNDWVIMSIQIDKDYFKWKYQHTITGIR